MLDFKASLQKPFLCIRGLGVGRIVAKVISLSLFALPVPKVFLWSPGWLSISDPPASASQVLGLLCLVSFKIYNSEHGWLK